VVGIGTAVAAGVAAAEGPAVPELKGAVVAMGAAALADVAGSEGAGVPQPAIAVAIHATATSPRPRIMPARVRDLRRDARC
jgi:hypothetical protein